ncbi:hypothetical protein [Mesorhizobium silamurunense]|uniref:hypothetical protein n=1 Tax=Mesorhizobium silamurunense TaxID=499528 RepID=UPI00177DA727|nr:hypothetical protein [Mesorhizobium silamurunense]
MLRIGAAPPGSTPFYKAADGLHFNGQNGRMIDFGHTFDRERGYRVFFKFQDSPASNTWGPDSLLKWCDELTPTDDAQAQLKATAGRLARQCVKLNREWERLGKPASGVPTDPAGSA